jgi:hypothetical protein
MLVVIISFLHFLIVYIFLSYSSTTSIVLKVLEIALLILIQIYRGKNNPKELKYEFALKIA